MKQPTPSEYLQYAQQMSKLRAQQEMEKLRLVYAQHQYVLEQVPHLKPAFEALLVLDETRDYAALAQHIDQNLVDLEAWLVQTWQPALQRYPELKREWLDLSREIDLYQFRRTNMFLNQFLKNVEQCEIEEKAQRKLEKELETYWSGFQKMGRNSEILPLTAPQWAAVKHLQTGLIWATNSVENDNFPVTRQLTWYKSGEGVFNDGRNTESHIQRVNQQRWCGQQDWYLPNKAELESLVQALYVCGAYSQTRYQAVFQCDEVGMYWSASPGAGYGGNAWYVNFDYGGSYDYGKGNSGYVRAVRAGQ